jgi:hypothetical protein
VSYLNRPRLHFAGRFEADVSTVNNLPANFDNARFVPGDDQRTTDNSKGAWNPRGTGSWRLIGCTVTAATYADGSVVPDSDPTTAMAVAHNRDRVAPKIVDLDPQQQLVSTLWGLELRLVDRSGADALRGSFEAAAFSDLWNRVPGDPNPGDFTLGAFYQSALTNVVWNDAVDSRWLRELRAAVGAGPVSVKFNVDGFSMDWTSPVFATGRIVGTIGPAAASDPKRFVLGRQLAPADASSPLNFAVAVVDDATQRIVVDLGNALPTAALGGPIALGTLTLAAFDAQTTVATFAYGGDGWYERTAGICEIPSDGPLSNDQLAQIALSPLLLLDPANGNAVVAAEAANGAHVRADQFVYRLDAGEQAEISLYTTAFGRTAPGMAVASSVGTQGLQPGGPPIGVPPNALIAEPSPAVSDANGVATLTLRTSDPGNARGYIDGQVYAVQYAVAGGIVDPYNFISVLLWTAVPDVAEPAWWPDLQPVFVQFGNLYPIMHPIVDLRTYDSVVAKRELLRAVFSLPVEHPNYMPVTRDLSGAKRKLILKWLATTGNNGLPNLGIPPPSLAAAVPRVAEAFAFAAAPSEAALDPNEERGAKTAAILRIPGLAAKVKVRP